MRGGRVRFESLPCRPERAVHVCGAMPLLLQVERQYTAAEFIERRALEVELQADEDEDRKRKREARAPGRKGTAENAAGLIDHRPTGAAHRVVPHRP